MESDNGGNPKRSSDEAKSTPDQIEKKKEKKNLKLPKDDFPSVFASEEDKDKVVAHLPIIKIKKVKKNSEDLQCYRRSLRCAASSSSFYAIFMWQIYLNLSTHSRQT